MNQTSDRSTIHLKQFEGLPDPLDDYLLLSLNHVPWFCVHLPAVVFHREGRLPESPHRLVPLPQPPDRSVVVERHLNMIQEQREPRDTELGSLDRSMESRCSLVAFVGA